MKTNQRLQMFALVLGTAGTVNAQSTPAPAAAPPPAAPQEVTPAAPAAAPTPAPAQPSAGMQPVEPPAPLYYGSGGEMGSYSRPQSTYAGRYMLGLNWDVAVPMGSVNTFTGNASPVGFELFFQYWLTSKFTVGAGLDWQTFWETKPRQTYHVENGALTATADNSVQNGAARFIARYYALDQGPVMPYVGVNIGIGWSTFQSAAADISFYDNTVSVLLGGELGAAFVISRDAPLFTIGGRYSTLPAADFLAVTNVQTITFQFGVMSP